jgi:hypothetical protein
MFTDGFCKNNPYKTKILMHSLADFGREFPKDEHGYLKS